MSQILLELIKENKLTDINLKSIVEKIIDGQRITTADGLLLFQKGTVGFLGTLANFIREQKNGHKTYYNHNFHIEPTNVCVFTCKFCSYSRLYKNKEEGWELSKEQILERVKAYDGKAITEVHIVGGVHPKMDLDYFCDVLKSIKEHRPKLHIKAFTAVELDYMFRKAKVSSIEGLKKLKDNGLNSLPGGGAEIFDSKIRKKNIRR